MLVREFMTKDVRSVSPKATVREAASAMRSLGVGILPVCDEDHLVGTVTDRDIVLRAVAQGADPIKVSVREVMTKNPDWCYEDQTIQEAALIMAKRRIRRVPVMDREAHLVGMLSLGDLAVPGEGRDLAAEILEQVAARRPKAAA